MNPQKVAGLAMLAAVLLPFLARCETKSDVAPNADHAQSVDKAKKIQDELREIRELIRKQNETKDAAPPSATRESENQKKTDEKK